MAESTADATAAIADTLRLELEKTMTEIVDEGGALKEIDKAIRILNRLREIESKKLEPNIPSPSRKVQVPKEFKCPLSYAIMSEPVVIASGQTYEKRYIRKWLDNYQTCPKTKEVLPYRVLTWSRMTPNHLIDNLITQWCRDNEYDRPNPPDYKAIGMMSDDIDSLLHQISSPSSVEDQTKAAKELCRQIQNFENVRAFFYAGMPDSITRFLSPVSALGNAVGSNPELQENIITALCCILGFADDKTVVAQIPLVIPLLTMSLKQGNTKTRECSAEAFVTLSRICIIVNSDTLKALIDAFKDGNDSAGLAVFNLCLRSENMEMAVSQGLITVLANKIKERSDVELILNGLSFMFKRHKGVIEEMEDLGFIDDLFSILRNPGCSKTAEKAVEVVFDMCCLDTGDRNRESARREVVEQEEEKYETFSKLAKQGSGGAVAILKWLKSGTESRRKLRKI